MATIHSLLNDCRVEPETIREQTQAQVALWENWLRPVAQDNPVGDDPGYDDLGSQG